MTTTPKGLTEIVKSDFHAKVIKLLKQIYQHDSDGLKCSGTKSRDEIGQEIADLFNSSLDTQAAKYDGEMSELQKLLDDANECCLRLVNDGHDPAKGIRYTKQLEEKLSNQQRVLEVLIETLETISKFSPITKDGLLSPNMQPEVIANKALHMIDELKGEK